MCSECCSFMRRCLQALKVSMFLLVIAGFPRYALAAALDPADEDGLIGFFNLTGGANWINNTGWSNMTGFMDTTNPPFGVSFDNSGRVASITLNVNNLVGDISALDLSMLTSLISLDLSSNQLTGNMPAAIKLPAGIIALTLSYNSLSGSVPDYSTLTALNTLTVMGAQLSGSLPDVTQLSPALRTLNLNTNQLTGTIPDYYLHANLIGLYLQHNQLNGSLPAVYQLPTNIQWLSLQGNNLTDTIPDYSVIATLTSLALSPLNIQGPTPAGVLAMPGAILTTTPAIDPALDGSSFKAVPITVTGTGGEVGGTVLLRLDGADVGGTFAGGVGEWSVTADLSSLAEGTHTFTVLSYFDAWPGYTAGQASTAASTPVSIFIDTTSPVITVLGNSSVTVAQGGTFADPGTSVTDNHDTGLIASVTGTVDSNTVGSYTLVYNATDNAGNAATPVSRIVNVTDQSAPVITLLGSNPATVTQGDTFTDPGATVSDNVDTGLTVTVSGTVDTSTIGTYTLNYNATDTAGNVATVVTRTVNVVAPSSSGGGGGSLDWMLLFILTIHFTLVWRRATE